jgi:hypothetical protein
MSNLNAARVVNALLFGLTFGSLNLAFDLAKQGQWGWFIPAFIAGMFFIGAYDNSVVTVHDLKKEGK